jgi:hypothetical protein
MPKCTLEWSRCGLQKFYVAVTVFLQPGSGSPS